MEGQTIFTITQSVFDRAPKHVDGSTSIKFEFIVLNLLHLRFAVDGIYFDGRKIQNSRLGAHESVLFYCSTVFDIDIEY